jgi:alpha-ketoglutarate-dependent taurine dioxygenase
MECRMIEDVRCFVPDGQSFPLVIEAESPSREAAAWCSSRRAWVSEQLARYGALLFRGFQMDLDRFNAFAQSTCDAIELFSEESSPRSAVSGNIYTSTDYPNRYPIQLHCEYSYASRWPMKLYFGCLTAPEQDGATPIADTREVLRRLSPETIARFRSRGILYRHNYHPQGKVTWEAAFRTTDPAQIERYCTENGIRASWLPGGGLSTSRTQAAILRHPVTGDAVWFNHAFFFNVRALEPIELREVLLHESEDDLQTNTYWGDGSPIDPAIIEELRAAYRGATVDIRWQRGDMLLIDNMLAAHGRSPYRGARKVVVIMADGRSRESHYADDPS